MHAVGPAAVMNVPSCEDDGSREMEYKNPSTVGSWLRALTRTLVYSKSLFLKRRGLSVCVELPGLASLRMSLTGRSLAVLKKIHLGTSVGGSLTLDCRLLGVAKAIKQSNKVGRQDSGYKTSVVQP